MCVGIAASQTYRPANPHTERHNAMNTGWQVPSHYDTLAEDSVRQRQEDAIAGVRVLNGFAKGLLIREAVNAVKSDAVCVVDLACGRGGDVGRFTRAAGDRPLTYVGLDGSANQITAARAREASGNWRLPAQSRLAWAVCDCFGPDAVRAARAIGPARHHVVSIQMAIHYAAESRARMEAALDNVAALCAPGGVLAITTTDWERVVAHATLAADGDAAATDVCSVTLQLPWHDEFGAKVRFKLGSRVDDDEWLVYRPVVQAMLEERGFQLVHWTNLQALLADSLRAPAVYAEWRAHARATITAADWDVVGLYCAALFVKTTHE